MGDKTRMNRVPDLLNNKSTSSSRRNSVDSNKRDTGSVNSDDSPKISEVSNDSERKYETNKPQTISNLISFFSRT